MVSESQFVFGNMGEGRFGLIVLDASKSNQIYGNSKTVQPESLRTHYIIKY